MRNETKERDWVEEVGKPAFDAIKAMVSAVQVDYDRLQELRDERQNLVETRDDTGDDTSAAGKRSGEYREAARNVKEWEEENAEELAKLEEAAGDCQDEDDARQRIAEDPLSLRVFGERTGGAWETTSYELLLGTGGPAVRIVGDLNEHGEPESARLEVQDWFKPWTEYLGADDEVLMSYAERFYFGE